MSIQIKARIKKLKFLQWTRYLFRVVKTVKRISLRKNKTRGLGLIEIKSRRWNYFHGYYDRPAFNPANSNLVLLHRTKRCIYLEPTSNVATEIVVYDTSEMRVVAILGSSHAWNWQQGSKAMWLNEKIVIYNYYDDLIDDYCAIAKALDGKVIFTGPPVQEILSSNLYVTISYRALANYRRDYGYFCHSKESMPKPGNVSIFNCNTWESEIIIDQTQAAELGSAGRTDKLSWAKFNHVIANISSTKICFMFRYMHIEKRRKTTDIFVYDLASKQVSVLVENSQASHYTWLSDDVLVYTGVDDGDNKFGLRLINVDSGEVTHRLPHSDGHPFRLSDQSFLLDSYADEYGIKHLYTYDLDADAGFRKRNEIIASVEPALLKSICRCDLHPTASSDLKFQIDVANGFKRSVLIGDLKVVSN